MDGIMTPTTRGGERVNAGRSRKPHSGDYYQCGEISTEGCLSRQFASILNTEKCQDPEGKQGARKPGVPQTGNRR